MEDIRKERDKRMDENTALTVVQPQMNLRDTMTLGRVLATSGRFSDTTNTEQAVVKVLAGQELGFGPIASMVGINIIQGRVSVSANLMAQAVKRSTKYDYRIAEMTSERCEIVFYEGGQEIGRSMFDKADAQKAGTKNMSKFPRNMLFARAMSNGVKWYCPDVFQTGVYTPEELGVEVDGDGEIINITPEPAITTTPTDGKHWIESENVRKRFWVYANVLTLSDADVHAALEVEHVGEYAGTMPEAKAALDAYISDRIAETDEAEAESPPPNADDLES